MQGNQQGVSMEQRIINNLGNRIGVLTADVEIMSAQMQVLQQQGEEKDARIAELEQKLEDFRKPNVSSAEGEVVNG